MAAACIFVSLSAPGAFAAAATVGGKDHGGVGRQAGRLVIVAATPSVSGALVGMAGLSLSAVVGGSRSRRNSAIAARAADLEQGLEEVEDFVVGDSASPPPSPAAGTKLYVGNLPWSVHSKQLAEIFQDVGNVELVEVIYDRETQKSRGFAFVTMSSVEDAQRAIEILDGSDLDGRIVKVNFPQAREGREGREGGRRSERPPRREFGGGRDFGGGSSYSTENKLFVGNLSWGVDDVSLESLFQEFGKVLKAEVVYDRATGRSRGFGFVTLSSASEVHLAISSLDGKEFDKRLLRVNLAGDKPPPREPREY